MVPHGRDWMGTPRQDWMDHRTGYGWTGYAGDGTPLAVSDRRTSCCFQIFTSSNKYNCCLFPLNCFCRHFFIEQRNLVTFTLFSFLFDSFFHRNSFLGGRAVEGAKKVHTHSAQRPWDGERDAGTQDTGGNTGKHYVL